MTAGATRTTSLNYNGTFSQRDACLPRQLRIMQVAPVAVILLYGLLLLCYLVQADANSSLPTLESSSSSSAFESGKSFRERIKAGPAALTWFDKILFGVLVVLSFELLNYLTLNGGRWLDQKRIPVRGKHLDELSQKDLLFVRLNLAATAPFVYIYLRYAYFQPQIVWTRSSISLNNMLWPLPALFVVYDFFYTILHWALHIQGIYGYIHKHHHHQKAPSRANVDAINVHPIEFFLGEYNHLWALVLCSQVMKIHVLCCVIFIALGGYLAGVNHTRYDIVFSIFGLKLFDSKAHDVHHRVPQSNYGQYIMLWDVVFGSYRPYNANDRINPKFQLDSRSGKSIAYMENNQLESKVE